MTTNANTALDDLATYLPDDRREAVHTAEAPCSSSAFVAAYVAAYGWADLEGAAELIGQDARELLAAVRTVYVEGGSSARRRPQPHPPRPARARA